MSILLTQKDVDGWFLKYGVRYFRELIHTTRRMEEAGEAACIRARQYIENRTGNINKIQTLHQKWPMFCSSLIVRPARPVSLFNLTSDS